MTWNYRVMRNQEETEISYAIYEVFYAEDGVTVKSWMQHPVSIWAETSEGINWMLDKMKEAYEKPILCHETGLEVV